MKFNKWTLGLAAVGAVSLASAVRADEAPKMSQLQTALSNTTLSGYIDTAFEYTGGNQEGGTYPYENAPAGTGPQNGTGVGKIDNFSLNDVDIAIDHPTDSTPWSAGYHIDLNDGADAVTWNGAVGANAAGVRQAYLALVTPVGSGITWHVGIQDDIIGYEGNTDGGNPNYTRSYGYYVEPTTLLGVVGSYTFNSVVSAQAGIANATSGANDGASDLSAKSYVGAVTLTAPSSWGFVSGGTLNIGTVLNMEKGGQDNFYVGMTVPTPCSKLKVGAAFDFISDASADYYAGGDESGYVFGAYGSFQATDKLAFNLRAEYFNLSQLDGPYFPYGGANNKGDEITATVQYNLWANVISRAEFRWDHSDEGTAFGSYDTGTRYANNYELALNLIYTF